MVNTTALKQRVLARGEELTGAAGLIMVGRLLEAAGDGLQRDRIALTGPDLDGTRFVDAIAIDQTVTTWTWVYGSKDERGNPFDPWHTDLDGAVFDETNYLTELDNGGFFSAREYWYPKDHKGCLCRVENVSGDAVFPGADGDTSTVRLGGYVIEVQRDQSVIRADVPPFWSSTVNAAGWLSALQEAQR